MKRKILAGSTSLRLRIFVQDSSSSVGAGLTGLAYNTAGLTWYYIRDADSATVQVTLATAVLGTWATGGLIVVDATNMPGVYEISVPNAAITGSDCVHMCLRGATNMVPVLIEVELDAVNYQSATAFITGINSLAPPGNWALESIDGSGRVLLQPTQPGVTIPTVTTVTNQLTAAQIATGVWQDATAGDFTAASSVGKCLYIANVAPGAAGGHFIAGSNAATTVNITGSLSGSVGSVTGLTTATIATALWQDLTSSSDFTTNNSIGKLLATYAAAPTTGAITTAILAAAVPMTGNTGNTVADCLNSARAQGFGAWAISGTTLTLYGSDGSTVVRTFTLNSSTSPTSRT